ncbi:hypothetical protein A0O34_09180 [Chryseobacterium glaciei]|uniref:DUF4249 domain-containing protein n=2 Tax=Chryseobacterium glaciei TaxID=1685010 RepID=A0A172XUQ7_9FLAO|nr:hypothetical protein A0O34_09180 [Chryseobacterium glaciei]
MINKKYLIIYSLLLCLVSCEEVIDLPLDDMSGKIVIEGAVTDEDGPYFVQVTRSRKISFEDSGSVRVANATVVITDDQGQTDTLKYENGVYKTVNLVTNYGRVYTLSVTVDGVTYKSTSKMPEYVEFEGLKQTTLFNGSEDGVGIIPIFTDPSEKGNYYLFKSNKTNLDLSPAYTVMSDDIGNGEVNVKPISNKITLKKNDTIQVEMRSVDASVYKYFKALPLSTLENSGVSVTPTNPPSNISNGALGYFSAHTTSTKDIIIK